MGVEPEELFHGKAHGTCEFNDDQSTAGPEHAAHFAQSAIEILEVAHTIRDGKRVERVVVERKRHAIFFAQRDAIGIPRFFHLFSPDGQHALREIGAGNVLRLQTLHGEECKVSRSGGDVEDLLRRVGF